jgi:hypothetical protein
MQIVALAHAPFRDLIFAPFGRKVAENNLVIHGVQTAAIHRMGAGLGAFETSSADEGSPCQIEFGSMSKIYSNMLNSAIGHRASSV